jgi:hypothetical protein
VGLLAVQVPLEDGDLVAEREVLGVFGAVVHGWKVEQRERVGHAEVRQSKQRSGRSWRSYGRGSLPRWALTGVTAADLIPVMNVAMARTDEVFGTRTVTAARGPLCRGR